jgi:hypothetical protein
VKQITETPNEHHWPRKKVQTVDCRTRDLVFRIADWTTDQDEPGYDVETYIGGVYDWNESAVFTRWEIQQAQPGRPNGRPWKVTARKQAMEFVRERMAKLL